MKKIYIYTLSSPSGEIKYVGKTTDIKRRLSSHVSEAKKNPGKRYVLNWIVSLLKNNEKPVITILEICDEQNWQEREKYWIKLYKESGKSLCNIDEGGLGSSGPKRFSKEELEKRRIRMSSNFSKFSNKDKKEI